MTAVFLMLVSRRTLRAIRGPAGRLHIVVPRITPIAPKQIKTPSDHNDFVFELKHDGFRAVAYNLRGWPLMEAPTPYQTPAGLLYAEHVEAKGVDLSLAICAKDLEGVVAKQKAGPSTSAPVSWFKVLNPDHTQKRGRREMCDKLRERRVHT